MRKETKYFAFDDTEFETEAECLEYEKKLDALWDNAIFLDEEFRIGNGIQFVEDKAIYIKVLNAAKAMSLFSWIESYYGVYMPPRNMVYNGGVYRYNEDSRYNYDDLTAIFQNAALAMEKIGEAVSKLG